MHHASDRHVGSVPTKIKYKDYLKAVLEIARQKSWICSYVQKPGSARRFDLLHDGQPIDMWVVHEADVIYSQDLKKTCEALKVTKKQFESVVANL